jgi:hypothetical protein
MAWYRKVTYPLILAIVIALITLISFFDGPDTITDTAAFEIYDWATIIVDVMIWIGVINIARYATRDITKRAPGRWYLAGFQLFLMAVMLISGFGEGSASIQRGAQSTIYWLYQNVYTWGALAISALSGLLTVTAAYRAFRARTLEATLFLASALLIMLRNAPIGGAIWGGFPAIGKWILAAPYAGLQRALMIGMGIGVISYAARYYLGREKGAFGVVE